ncbi:hypothetical protein F511_11506 [Dorcoceras hygrometricum]|uniref:Uncharacterized protein n=1 Tax=Dorcoceras hygrometricum TaxID=472368 RepID=A0A2Z7DAJ8_9LAMI|nr:hypothetical protein F511_11506 [Dorcoceras hygrometricum]
MLMTAITFDVKMNWSSLLFGILKEMVTPGSRQAKGYTIHICVLLKNIPGLELGELRAFPIPRVLTEKTVHRYVVINEKVGTEEVADAPRVKKTPVKKAVSQKRPAAVDVEVAPVVKKKRTTKGKPVVIAQEEKRKRRLVLEAEDEIVDDQPAAEAATGIQEPVIENDQAVTEPAVGTVLVEPVVEKSPVDEPDVSGAHVEDQPAGPAAERPWFDLPYEDIIAQLNDRPVVTPSDTDEDELIIDAVTEIGAATDCVVGEPVDEEMGNDEGSVNVRIDAEEAMTLEDIILSIPVDVPLSSAGVEITKIILGQTVYIPGVDEGDWYKASLPKIHPDDREGDSCGERPNEGKRYILLKYREMLLRKFLEARRINFTPGDGSSTVDLKILDQLSDIHSFVLEELKKETQAHCLTWKKTCCSKIFEGRPRDRGAVIARTNTNTPSRCWIRTMLFVDGFWAVEPCADQWVKIPQPSVHNEVPRQRSYDDTLPIVSTFFRVLRKQWADVCLEVCGLSVSERLLPVGSINFCRSLPVVQPVFRFTPHQPTFFALRLSQFCTVFIRYSLFSSLTTEDIRNFVGSIASERTVLRNVELAVGPVFALEDNQMDIDHRIDSPIRFTSDDIPLDDTADVQTTFPAVTADISTLLDAMKISLSQRMDDAQSDILSRIHTIERGLRDTLRQQDEYFRHLI